MDLDTHYKKHASRKFIYVILALLFASVLAYIGHIGEVLYRDIVLGLMTVYTTGNVWQKHIEKKAGEK